MKNLLIFLIIQDQLDFARAKGAPVLVSVYYEALCPDSKNFIVKQLKSAYTKVHYKLHLVVYFFKFIKFLCKFSDARSH